MTEVAAVRILPAAARAALPWKNGGGLTREVAIHPPGSDLGTFEWRVSIAQVRAAGPFSSFPGVDRQLAVLAGELALVIADAVPRTLTPETPPLAFPGEVAASAMPVSAEVTDLNVMTRRGHVAARLARHAVNRSLSVDPRTGSILLLALSPLRLHQAALEWPLAPLDAALLGRASRCELRPQAVPGEAYLIELFSDP
ncbi:MAG: HutD family protein [Gammaproteobacteria bacterium]|nr:HutD family protein [Gammaproteobacteria bacterium]